MKLSNPKTNQTTKFCKSCSKILPIENFHISNLEKDGHYYYCRNCVSVRAKKKKEEKQAYKPVNASFETQVVAIHLFMHWAGFVRFIKPYVSSGTINSFDRTDRLRFSDQVMYAGYIQNIPYKTLLGCYLAKHQLPIFSEYLHVAIIKK